jgi:dienelactone hydrolase
LERPFLVLVKALHLKEISTIMKVIYSIFILSAVLFSCSEETNEISSATEQEMDSSKQLPYPEVITFPSLDGLEITGNLYEIGEDKPVIVLCHQARYNKAEYHGIAERLNELGFNCLAIDQRSGGPIAEYQNETNLMAVTKNKGVDFLDAEQDIIAAVDFASDKFDQSVILWGSSYSSTLVLYVAAENKNVRAVVSFSPGDYFQPEKESLINILPDFEKPMFVTSSQREAEELTAMVEAIGLNENQQQFVPNGSGHHGSRALWINQEEAKNIGMQLLHF